MLREGKNKKRFRVFEKKWGLLDVRISSFFFVLSSLGFPFLSGAGYVLSCFSSVSISSVRCWTGIFEEVSCFSGVYKG